jgi:hypothetical protein
MTYADTDTSTVPSRLGDCSCRHLHSVQFNLCYCHQCTGLLPGTASADLDRSCSLHGLVFSHASRTAYIRSCEHWTVSRIQTLYHGQRIVEKLPHLTGLFLYLERICQEAGSPHGYRRSIPQLSLHGRKFMLAQTTYFFESWRVH